MSQPPARKDNRRLEYALAGALALVFSGLVCAPRWLEGKSVFAGVIQEQYYILGQYSFDHQVVEDFRAGFFPLWNPHNALGTPLVGNMLSSVFYPLKVLVYVSSTVWMRDFFIVIRLWLAAFFAYVFARSRGLGRPGAFTVMAGFSMTGYLRVFINENYLNADVLVPLLLVSFDRLVRPGRLRHIILAGAVLFAVINNGHPEAAFYTMLFGGLYFMAALIPASREDIAPALLRLWAGILLGFLLSLPMLLPFLEYWLRGLHFHPPGAGFYHYPVRQAAALLSPWFFSQAEPGAPFLGPVNMAWNMIGRGIPDYSITKVPWLIPYTGMGIFFLAVASLFRAGKLDSRSLFFMAFMVFFLGVMFGLPGFNLVGFLPVFDFSGNFKHAMPAVSFAMAFLAGGAIDAVIEHRLSFVRLIAAGAVVFAAIVLFGFIHEPLASGRDYFNPETGIQIFILLCLVVWLAAASRWRAPSLLVGAVSVFSITAGLMLDSLWHRSFGPDYIGGLKRSAALRYMARDAGPFRAYVLQGIMPPNLNIILGLDDLRVMDGVNDRRFVEVVDEINGLDRLAAFDYWYRNVGYLQPRPEAVDHPLLKLLNVRYLVSDNPLPFHATISDFLEKGSALLPSPGHLGRTRLPFQEGEADALYQHPPCRIDLDLNDTQALFISFQPGIDERAWSTEKDGVWFGINGAVMDGGSVHLAYARYIHPRGHDSDREPPLTTIPMQGYSSHVILSTLPHMDPGYDWSGWSDLRIGDQTDPALDNYGLAIPGSVWLYESLAGGREGPALDRAFLAGWAEVLPDESKVLEAIAVPEYPYERRVFLSGRNLRVPFTAPFDWKDEWEDDPEREKVSFELYSPQRVRLKVGARMDCWLVLSDLYYPGWRASVDGLARRIHRGDYLLRTLPIEAGDHVVEFIYRPWSFRIGLWSALVSIFTLVLLPVIKRVS